MDKHDDRIDFLEKRQLPLTIPWRSAAVVAIILSQEALKQLALSVVTGMTQCEFILQATITLIMANEQGYSNFVCMCLQTHSTTELNQKLTIKACPEDACYGAFTRGKNTYA